MGMAVQCSNFNHRSLKSFRDAKMCCKDFQLKLDRWKGLLWLYIFPQSCQRDKAGGEKRMQRSGKAITHFGELEAWDGKLLS